MLQLFTCLALSKLKKLQDKGMIVTPEEFAAHANLTEDGKELEPLLRKFIDHHVMDSMVDPEERQTLENALRIIKTLMIPHSLLKVEEKKRPKIPRRPG